MGLGTLVTLSVSAFKGGVLEGEYWGLGSESRVSEKGVG